MLDADKTKQINVLLNGQANGAMPAWRGLSDTEIKFGHTISLSGTTADYGNATILYTPDVDTIAGYPCKKAVAIFDKMPQEEIELWYTDRIKMQDPNWFGPFAEIPGVLLRYEMLQNGIRMHLDAVSVTPGEVDPGKFRSKEEFQKVEAPVLHHELAEVLGTFSM